MKASNVIGVTLFAVLLILSACDTGTGADTPDFDITEFEVTFESQVGPRSVDDGDELGPYDHSSPAEFQVSATVNTSAAIHTWAIRNDTFDEEDEFISIDPVAGETSQETIAVGVAGTGENEITLKVSVIDSAGNEVEHEITFTIIFLVT